MKPRIKIEHAVHDLAKHLPALTQEQVFYAQNKMFPKLCYRTKNTAFCLECGNGIDVNDIVRNRAYCACCNINLKVKTTRKTTLKSEKMYFTVVEIVRYGIYDFQVLRNFEFQNEHRKGKSAEKFYREVSQIWYDQNSGKEVINASLISGSYNPSYTWSNLEIRSKGRSWYGKDYSVNPDLHCPTSKFRPDQLMLGINHKLKYRNVFKMQSMLNSSSKMETLFKANYLHILFNWREFEIEKYWNTLKICLRNKYKITKPQVYKDMLYALEYLGKDLSNAHFVCPKNLDKAHDYWIDKKQREVKKRERITDEQKCAKKNPQYIKKMQKFFDIEITKGNIKIEPLKSVFEFLDEGLLLSHCVFKGSYYERENSLVLSAKISGKNTETIEVDLKSFEIKQCYGFKNKPTKYNSQIKELVEKNMHLIRERAKKPKRQRKLKVA